MPSHMPAVLPASSYVHHCLSARMNVCVSVACCVGGVLGAAWLSAGCKLPYDCREPLFSMFGHGLPAPLRLWWNRVLLDPLSVLVAYGFGHAVMEGDGKSQLDLQQLACLPCCLRQHLPGVSSVCCAWLISPLIPCAAFINIVRAS